MAEYEGKSRNANRVVKRRMTEQRIELVHPRLTLRRDQLRLIPLLLDHFRLCNIAVA